jgi:hypothetical protein
MVTIHFILGIVIIFVGVMLTLALISAPLYLIWKVKSKDLTAVQSSSTLFRFFKSSHVQDLRAIFGIMYFLFVFLAILFMYIGIESQIPSQNHPDPSMVDKMDAKSDNESISVIIKDNGQGDQHSNLGSTKRFLDSVTLFPPIALALGAIISWSYRTASSRLGVVDLFACEIDSLCKVGTIVDIMQRFQDENEAMPIGGGKAHDGKTENEAKEDYFPIFNNNARDLQVLEASVVTNITAFYTYMKAFRDSRRLLRNNNDQAGIFLRDVFNVVYMLFLAYESARKATKDLVEYEPAASESIITIMITELKCYAYLVEYCRKTFPPEDIRAQRLDLRRQDYITEVNWIYALVAEHKGHTSLETENVWRPACRLIEELRNQFQKALKQDLDERVLKIAPFRAS